MILRSLATRRARRALAVVLGTAACVPLLASTATAGPTPDAAAHEASSRAATTYDKTTYDQTTYDQFGIPHVRALTNLGLGYGIGQAQARDAVCVLAAAYLTVDAQRSRFLGPDGTYVLGGSEAAPNVVGNLASDLYFQRLIDTGEVDRLVETPAPAGPSRAARQTVKGFVAGYNRYVREVGKDGITDPACKGADWVRPITEATAWRYVHQLSTLASSTNLINEIAAAQPPAVPPTPTEPSVPPAPVAPQDAAATVAAALDDQVIGSNGIAVGAKATVNGRGVLVANPHFPWSGGLRFWQMHLTAPGLNVVGGGLLGVPTVQIGHNRDVAWTHTVSPGRRFTPYQLTLVPGDPTSYLVDGQPKAMTPETVSVQSRRTDGTLETVTRTLWSSRYGPVVTSAAGLPLPWTATSAHAVRDVNATNLRFIDTWLQTGRTHSTTELDAVLKRTQGIPWVTTVATDRKGKAYYGDVSVFPHVSDELAARCNTPLGSAIFPSTGLPILDGSRSDCAWGSAADAVQPGTLGSSALPTQVRDDYVTNSNGSPWLTNVAAPLTGYPRIVGDVATPRSLRTRMAHTAVADRIAGTDGLPGRGFSRETGEQLILANRGKAPELVLDDLVALCRSLPSSTVPSASGPVDAREACDVLAGWDRRYDIGSDGAVLFSRFWQRALAVAGGPYAVPFSPADPVGTPSGLAGDRPGITQALGDAIRDLQAAGVPLTASVDEAQAFVDKGERIGLHGGPESDGVLNKITPLPGPPSAESGVGSGSSYLQVVEFTDDGCDARTVLAYSQSPDPTSPHHGDQTRLYAAKQWVESPIC